MRRQLRRSTRVDDDESRARALRSSRRSSRLASPRTFEDSYSNLEELKLTEREIKEIEARNDRDDEYEDVTVAKRLVRKHAKDVSAVVEEDDDEEDAAADADEEIEQVVAPKPARPVSTRRRRGRPPGSKNKLSLLLMSVDYRRRKGRSAYSQEPLEDADSNVDDADDEVGADGETPRKRRRPGRKPGTKIKKKVYSPFPKPLDEEGNEVDLNEDEDEYIIPDDPIGDKKVDQYGNLLGDRDFRVRTFTVKDKGAKLYMLSTEPARCLGYRDAYYLFLKHPTLYKFILSYDEKQDLVDRKILPNSYKSRTIGLVTARSIFKEFGSKIVIGGKKIIDDYYEDKARENGDVEGEIAVPDDPVPENKREYNKKRYIAWYGGSQIYQQLMALQFGSPSNDAPGNNTGNSSTNIVNKYANFPIHRDFALKSNASENVVNEENWIYEHSTSANSYNADLVKTRLSLLEKKKKGIKDLYTGVYFYPSITQPHSAVWYKQVSLKKQSPLLPTLNDCNWAGLNGDIKNNNDGLVYHTVIESGSLVKRTGLKNVSLETFSDCVSTEVKNAILEQQKLERL